MDPRANMVRMEIKDNLREISGELEQIAVELSRYRGVGTEYCAKKLMQLAHKYNRVRNQL